MTLGIEQGFTTILACEDRIAQPLQSAFQQLANDVLVFNQQNRFVAGYGIGATRFFVGSQLGCLELRKVNAESLSLTGLTFYFYVAATLFDNPEDNREFKPVPLPTSLVL